MSVWTALLAALQALPELVSIYKEISAKMTALIEVQRQSVFNQETRQAIAKAIATKDTGDLEKIFR